MVPRRIVRNTFLLLILILVAWYVTGCLLDKSAVRKLEAKVRKQGDPLTINELAATVPNIPDDQNVAIALLDLWEQDDPAFWRAIRRGERPTATLTIPNYDPELPYLGARQSRVAPGHQLSPASEQALEVCLSSQSNHLHAVRMAVRRVPLRCRFPIQWQETYDALLPHLRKLKSEAEDFRLEALQAARAGDSAGALAIISDILRVGDALAEEPTLISQLVRANCVGIALNSAEDLLSRQPLSQDQLNELQKMFAAIQPRKMLRLAIASERVASLSAFTHNAKAFTSASDPDAPTPAEVQRLRLFFSLTGLAVADRRSMLETTQEAINIAEDTSPSSFQRLKGLDATAAKPNGVPPRIFASMLMPPIVTATGRFFGLEARLQAANVAFAVERYRLRERKLPQTLSDLAPDHLPKAPVDPFDLQPFRYQRFATGYVVYSIGADFADDGGKNRLKTGGSDEIFRVNR